MPRGVHASADAWRSRLRGTTGASGLSRIHLSRQRQGPCGASFPLCLPAEIQYPYRRRPLVPGFDVCDGPPKFTNEVQHYEPGNERDRIFDAALLLDIDLGPEMTGRSSAVLDVA